MILFNVICFPLGIRILNRIKSVHLFRPPFLFIMFIILCTDEYERVGCNYYFQKYESNGGTRGNPRGPSNTTLQWFSFQKNNTVGTLYMEYIIYNFFQTFLCYRTKGFLVPFMSTHNTPFIFQVFFNNTSGTRYCYCWTAVKTPNIIVII